MASDVPPATDDHGPACGCKVGRVADRYDLDDLDGQLVERWRGDGTDRHSLRQLEAYVDRRILRAAMERAGDDPLPGEVANVHRLLVDDDVSAGVRVETRRRLEYQGVDVEAVSADFVSHQSIHTHLTGCLGVSHEAEPTGDDRVEGTLGTVQALRSRLEAVGSGSLRQLRDAGVISLDGFEVLADVSVVCHECGRSYGVEALLERGGCECQDDD